MLWEPAVRERDREKQGGIERERGQEERERGVREDR
jgi:hypothetical protein